VPPGQRTTTTVADQLPVDKRVNTIGGTLLDGITVADGDRHRLECRHAPNRCPVLLNVQVEGRPSGLEAGPRRDRVACEQEAMFGCPEGEMPRRMARGVQDLEPRQFVFLPEPVVDWAGRMLPKSEPESDLEREPGAKREPGENGDGLRFALAGDDVRLPLMR
jgi:hypothetical protein